MREFFKLLIPDHLSGGEVFAFAILAALPFALLQLFVAVLVWDHYKMLQKPFNYRVTDMWAAIVGLVPTIMLAAMTIESSHVRNGDDFGTYTLGTFIVLTSQLFGLYIGRLSIEFPPHAGAKSAFHSANSIFTGAAVGFVLALIFTLTFTMSPAILLIGIMLMVQLWRARWKRLGLWR
jgi:hypothetical protein